MSTKSSNGGLTIRLLKPSSPFTATNSRAAVSRRAAMRAQGIDPPGYIDGMHHTAYVATIRTLKSTGQREHLEQLLLRLVDATEEEARHVGCAVASGYYRELARLYRKSNDPAREKAILMRFAEQTHAPGIRAKRLVKRLADLPPSRGSAEESGGTGPL